jgi:minor extracellular serine protease Vpr
MTRRSLAIVSAVLIAVLVTAGGALAGKPSGSKPDKAPVPAAQHDFTEAPTAQTQSEYWTVVFADPAAASYEGGISGLERTKPLPGQKLNPNSRAVRKYKEHLKGVHDNFRGWLASKAPAAEAVREQFLTGNTLVYKLNGADAGLLSQGPAVKRAAPSAVYRPTMNISTGLIGATAVWGSLGGQANAGSGIKVGIIDTGIDDTHPAFDCKGDIQHKAYASGAAAGPQETIVNDHGTHVAGTVAGCVMTAPLVAGTWSGVAPGAQLFDYNVFPGFGAPPGSGSAFSHDIAQALEDAVADGMDVVNMSLGGTVQGPHDSLAEATNATVDAGVVAAVAAGNSGPGGSTVESPGSAAGALTAGASTNPHFIGIPVTYTRDGGGGGTIGAALGDFANYDPPVSAAYTVTTPANGCTAITNNVSGKIALIDRGVCTFGTKIRNAEAAGAVGVLVANNVAGDPVAMASDGLGDPEIPAAMVSKNDGAAMKPSGNASVDGTSPQEFITTNADIIAGFSSRGPTPFTFLIKPDATAPGVNVYSSVFEGGFAMFQGTSMATPHLAGTAALLLDAHPGWSPADVKSAIVTTGKRPVWDHVNGTAPVGVLVRGGGRVDVPAANAVPLTFDPASVSFGFWNGNKTVQGSMTVRVKNVSSSTQLCGAAFSGSPVFSVSPSAFSVAAGGTAALTVSLSGGSSSQTPSGDYSGDVVVTCGGTTLELPTWTRINREGKP